MRWNPRRWLGGAIATALIITVSTLIAADIAANGPPPRIAIFLLCFALAVQVWLEVKACRSGGYEHELDARSKDDG